MSVVDDIEEGTYEVELRLNETARENVGTCNGCVLKSSPLCAGSWNCGGKQFHFISLRRKQ